MGCDIHLVVQRRVDGSWEDVDLGLGEEEMWDFWEARSYDTFALLADVRNDGTITPISKPRGIPSDFDCDDYRRPSERWGQLIGDVEHNGKDLGEHSHSWVTLAEILAAPDRVRCMDDAVVAELESFGAPDDVRLVFGFDS